MQVCGQKISCFMVFCVKRVVMQSRGDVISRNTDSKLVSLQSSIRIRQ